MHVTQWNPNPRDQSLHKLLNTFLFLVSLCVVLDIHAWLTTLRLRPSFLPRTHRAPQCYQMSRTGHDIVTLLPQSQLSSLIFRATSSMLALIWVTCESRVHPVQSGKWSLWITFFVFCAWILFGNIFIILHETVTQNVVFEWVLSFWSEGKNMWGGGWLYFFAKLSYIFP